MTRLAWTVLALLLLAGCGSDGEKTAADGGPDQGIADQGIADQGAPPAGAWAISAGGPEGEDVRGIAVDGQGNSTVIGVFMESLTLGTTTLTVGSSGGAFVTRLDPTGRFVWAVSHGGCGDNDVAVDSAGNSYVTGLFDGTATFGSTTLKGTADLYVAKLDVDGNFLWAVSGDNSEISLDSIRSKGIAVDGQGNCYVAGYFFGTVTFGTTTLTAGGAGGGSTFVAKLDVDGNFLWAKAVDGAMAADIAVDSAGNSHVSGGFNESATFGATTLTAPAGGFNSFVAKLDVDGNWLWAAGGGATTSSNPIMENGDAIAVDGSGNAYVTGVYGGPATFGSTTLPDCGPTAACGYVAKLDSGGAFVWAVSRQALGVSIARVVIALDSSGNSYVTGQQSTLAVKLDPSGNDLWSVPCPDDPAKGTAIAAGIGVDNAGDSYVAGYFMGTISVGAVTFKSKGQTDLFVVKLPADGTL